jgi:hypothetical protein
VTAPKFSNSPYSWAIPAPQRFYCGTASFRNHSIAAIEAALTCIYLSICITNYFWIAFRSFYKLITLLKQKNRSKALNKVNTLFKVPIKGLI